MASGSGNVLSRKKKGKAPRDIPENFGEVYIVSPTAAHKATIVWLHDLGQTGHLAIERLKNLGLPNLKWICPTAPVRLVTSLGGTHTNAWCNITKVQESMQHNFQNLEHVNLYVADLLSNEPKKVIKGVEGIGLGAAAALYFATSYAFGRIPPKIKVQFVIGINGWLPGLENLQNNMNSASENFKRASSLQILFTYGTSDDVVPSAFAHNSALSLSNNGFPTIFKLCGGDHVVNEIRVWLAQNFGI